MKRPPLPMALLAISALAFACDGAPPPTPEPSPAKAASPAAEGFSPDTASANDESKASPSGETKCVLRFTLRGWSAFYKTASGSGTITCDNGERADVRISSKGGGLSFGKSKITDGIGRFSAVDSIDELFGAYAQAEAHAGVAKSSRASVVTKGEVSLALAGTGRGINVGVDFGRFEITRR